MNQDARDESTPTGQALGTLALLVAGTATVAGGAYAGSRVAKKLVSAADKGIGKVTGRKAKDIERMYNEVNPVGEGAVNKQKAKNLMTQQAEDAALKKSINRNPESWNAVNKEQAEAKAASKKYNKERKKYMGETQDAQDEAMWNEYEKVKNYTQPQSTTSDATPNGVVQ